MMHHEHKDIIFKVTIAIDDCEGLLIPYPLAKKMAEVSKELKGYLEQIDAEGLDVEDEPHPNLNEEDWREER